MSNANHAIRVRKLEPVPTRSVMKLNQIKMKYDLHSLLYQFHLFFHHAIRG